LAESFVDSFKTELIADRVWRSRSQVELAVEYIAGSTPAACTPQSTTKPPMRSKATGANVVSLEPRHQSKKNKRWSLVSPTSRVN
jgi:hypothetical protein